MRCLAALAVAVAAIDSVSAVGWLKPRASSPAPAAKRSNIPRAVDPGFVSVQNGQFMKDGKPFFYFGTNAYWLQHLSDENLNLTLTDIAARNFTVVRTWAFNDVTEIPSSGAWFQLFNPNGTVTINSGPSGFQRLDTIVKMAEEKGLLVQFTLTNNWNPLPNETLTSSGLTRRQSVSTNTTTTNTTIGRGVLSNDYGGMDAYVRAHNLTTHDQFYANETLIQAFENYLTVLVPRYANSTSVLAWEIANDARCASSINASSSCKTTTITTWHSRIADAVKKLDPNHVVASGTQGFQCVASAANPCTKLFLKPAPTQPQPSPRAAKRGTVTLTEKAILADRRAQFQRNVDELTRRFETTESKRSARPKWSYRGKTVAQGSGIVRRQASQGLGPAMDGSQGIDSLDIGAIPNIGFSTFQLFPDQNVYAPPDPNLPALNNTINAGVNWIAQQAAAAAILNKPLALTGFGLVTQNNLPNFVPFNSSQPLFPALTSGATSTSSSATPTPTPGVGVEQGQTAFTDQEQASIYQQWIQAALNQDVQGIVQYQWGQANLAPTEQNTTPAPSAEQGFTPLVPSAAEQNVSPNDGYQAISPVIQNVLQLGAIRQNLKNIDIASAFPS